MATYVNDLRLKEIATGDESGTWGASTNTNLELIGEALGYNTQDCFSSDADATTTVADGVSDPARAMYFKVTSSATLTATRTLTVAPNTISRVMFIENATTGSQSITISQGSGANVTIATGRTTVVYLDGAGAAAAVVDALALVDPGVTDTLAEVLVAGNSSSGTNIVITAGDEITVDTISETTSANGVSIDGVLLKDDSVNTDTLEVTNIKANDGTAAGSIAQSTGVVTLTSSVLTTTDINGGTIDGTVIGGTSAVAGTFTTINGTAITASGDLTVDTNTLKVDSTNNRVGVLNASPAVSLDAGSATDAFHVPVGTTAQRPTGAAGHFRYNTTLEQFEGYTDDWGQIGGGGGANAFATDSYTGDGSTTAYALSQVVVSEDNLLVFIEGVFQQQDAYSIATAGGATTLTFSAAPANGNDILIYSVVSAISGTNLNSDTMTGDGSDTTLTLSLAPVNENNTQVYIDGVYQNKDTYSISGTTLTFSAAPPNGSAVEVMTMNQLDINTPTDGSVTSAKLSGDLVTPGALDVTGTVTADGAVIQSDGAAVTVSSADYEVALLGRRGSSGVDLDKGFLRLKDTGTNKVVLDSAGDSYFNGGSVGIGTSSPTYSLSVNSGSSTVPASLESTGTDSWLMLKDTNTTLGNVRLGSSSNSLIAFAGGSEAMRIVSSGALLVGKTAVGAGVLGCEVRPDGTIAAAKASSLSGSLSYLLRSTTLDQYQFYVNMAGTISARSTSISSLSDERVKENIVDLETGLDEVMALRPRRFDWSNNSEETQIAGFIAQEVETVLPDLIGTYQDDNISDLKSLKMGDMIPTLVKAIQEQQATITALTARIEQLENN